jgi:hypothetical protein
MSLTRIVFGIFILNFSFFSVGCNQQKEVLTKAEVLEFANTIEKTIARGDADFLNNALDKIEFAKRTKIEGQPDAIPFLKGTLKSFKIGNELLVSLTDKDDFSLVKYYEKEGAPHVIFRVYFSASNDINYHDYELVKTNGKCRIADVYFYLAGEKFSETVRGFSTTLTTQEKLNSKPNTTEAEALSSVATTEKN